MMRTHTRSRGHRLTTAVMVAALLLVTGSAYAQTNLNFKRVSVNWPIIELYFATDCSGQPAWDLQKSDIRIFENGIEVDDFTLFCPVDTARCAISVSLVFDASGSMQGTGNAGAKQAGRTFTDQMDGVVDEATIIWFNTQVNIAQQMTTLKPLLYTAVDGLPASGGTAVWDGTYAGIIELINNGVNQCRAVVVMTDGADNSSTRTPAEIISLANRNRIRVYTVGVGSSINATELEMIALLTGGKYYQTPNAAQVADIYRQIANIILNYFEECTITYRRDCADGTLRNVELGVYDFCGGTDVKTKVYRAPLDSSTFGDLHMSLTKTVTMGGEEARVTLTLDDNLAQAYFPPLSLELHYDSTLLTFRDAAAAAGGPLDSVGLDVTLVRPGVLSLATTEQVLLSGSGPLLQCLFEAKFPQDTSCTLLSAKNVTFAYGCFDPLITYGEVCVFPRSQDPVIVCEGITAPTRLAWDAAAKQLTPSPFAVTARHRNVGLADGEQFYFRLQYDSTKLRLADSIVQVRRSFPADSSITSLWDFEARPRSTDDTARVCVTAVFMNHPPVDCCVDIFIPGVPTVLDCSLQAPAVYANHAEGRYAPMPFPLTVTAFNRGGTATQAVWGTVHLPPGLHLAGPDAPNRYSKSFPPAQIQPEASASLTWLLLQAPADTATLHRIPVTVRTANADSTQCEIAVLIPALPNPRFPFDLQVGGSSAFCEGDSLRLDAPPGFVSYQWSTGDSTAGITVRASGDYFCTVRDTAGWLGVSDTVSVTVHPRPRPQLVVQGSIPKCPEDTVTLDAGAGYVSYSWNAGSAQRMLAVSDAGEYFCTVTDMHGCIGVSDTVTVTELTPPVTPVIKRSVDTLKTVTAASWQWYRNGQPIPGATAGYLVLTQTGLYQVEITEINGCRAMSDPFDVQLLALRDPARLVERFDVYPNPGDGLFTVHMALRRTQPLRLEVIDALGRVVYRVMEPAMRDLCTEIDLRAETPGLYFLRVSAGTIRLTKKLLYRGRQQ